MNIVLGRPGLIVLRRLHPLRGPSDGTWGCRGHNARVSGAHCSGGSLVSPLQQVLPGLPSHPPGLLHPGRTAAALSRAALCVLCAVAPQHLLWPPAPAAHPGPVRPAGAAVYTVWSVYSGEEGTLC